MVQSGTTAQIQKKLSLAKIDRTHCINVKDLDELQWTHFHLVHHITPKLRNAKTDC